MSYIIVNSKTFGEKKILVDNEYKTLLERYYWHIMDEGNGNFYAYTNLNRDNNKTSVSMHRFLHPEWQIVDHINSNGLDNREINLRQSNSSSNNKNKTRRNKTFSSKYKGVSFASRTKMWKSSITKDKVRIHIGFFSDEKSAAMAYNEQAKILHGEFARLNDVNVLDYKKHLLVKTKSSKYKYISWDSRRKSWELKYKTKFLGRFETEEDANKFLLKHKEQNGIF